MTGTSIMLVALVIDAVLGWPALVFARIGHPVTWIGVVVSALDQHLNRDAASDTTRRLAGMVTALAIIGFAAGAGWLATAALPDGWPGVILSGLLAWPLLAVRSMHDHVAAVARPLAAGDLVAARAAVAMIVGRDPAGLDAAGMVRAAVESLAENTSDGIVAPVFCGVLFGPDYAMLMSKAADMVRPGERKASVG